MTFIDACAGDFQVSRIGSTSALGHSLQLASLGANVLGVDIARNLVESGNIQVIDPTIATGR